ncbi:LLM class flavin-dependent oxidoreductase [Paraflavitalea sp. CAU 1676]|uniref:LLM class flavin-dependent oxidoreductase n=1 Tax=Paraflavitalea sp. CAU 1676 TaxID=3032598 RepID=UPI0023DA1BF7|nr:LLM class flavin-dependent oxidoreductase [Paraflavitalea sp. CAU 1676]MDF2191103.1 LLM class flavin-dependent oxidoreductase [Paraflavitalea sp. CAU 1676]
MSLQLSVLDQTPIRRGSNAVESLQESIQLARLADHLGYTRYWLSEHHNSATLAMAAPEILIARLAGETNYIRFGSGGIMLPNHSAFKVAENFRLLEALYPNRIDLGIGRAPGGDRISAKLLNPSNNFDPQEYIQQIKDLQAYLTDTPGEANLEGKIKAIPVIDTVPEMWMLTSSGESGYLAAHAGMALSYAQFINPVGGADAVDNYRKRFRPSQSLTAPKANLGIFAFTSESEKKAHEVQAVMDYRLLSFEKGQYNEMPTYEIAKSYNYSPGEWQRVLFNRGRMAIGTPDVVKEKITALTREFDVDEVVIATFAESAEDRFRSYELFSEVFELAERQTRQYA